MKNLRGVAFGLIVLWSLGTGTACKKNAEQTGAKSDTGRPAAEPKTVERELVEAEAQLKGISPLLVAHDYQAAGEIHDQVFERLENLRLAKGDPVLPSGSKLGAEIARLQNQITDQLTIVLQSEIEALRKAAPDNVNIPRLFKCFPAAADSRLKGLHAAALPELDRIRSRQAPRWIRVEADNEFAGIAGPTLEAVGNRIQAPPGYRLVYGAPTGPKEEAATYCTFTLNLSPQIEKYVESKLSHVRSVSSEGLLVGFTLTMRLKSRSPEVILGRVWASGRNLDRDGSLRWSFGPNQVRSLQKPAEIVVPDETTTADYFRSSNRARSADLRAKIKTDFALLRVFDFHQTGGAPAPLSSDQALFDRPAFVAAFRAAPPGKTSADEAWCRVVEFGIEELAPDLAKGLPTFSPDLRRMVIQALTAQPWFGDYEPLLQCVRSGDPRSADEALKLLRPELNELKEPQRRVVTEAPTRR